MHHSSRWLFTLKCTIPHTMYTIHTLTKCERASSLFLYSSSVLQLHFLCNIMRAVKWMFSITLQQMKIRFATKPTYTSEYIKAFKAFFPTVLYVKDLLQIYSIHNAFFHCIYFVELNYNRHMNHLRIFPLMFILFMRKYDCRKLNRNYPADWITLHRNDIWGMKKEQWKSTLKMAHRKFSIDHNTHKHISE